MTTHYIRNVRNNTVVDVESLPEDLHAVVCLDTYSPLLLELVAQGFPFAEVVADFYALQEIRGEWFENIEIKKQFETPFDLARERVRAIADKYGLSYVED
jgi:hypothetical protein